MVHFPRDCATEVLVLCVIYSQPGINRRGLALHDVLVSHNSEVVFDGPMLNEGDLVVCLLSALRTPV